MVLSCRFRPRFWFIKWTKLYKGTTQPATPAMWKTSSPSASPASNRQTEDPPEEVEVAQTEIPEEDNVATPPTTPIDMNAEASRKRANFISQLKARESLRGRDNRGNLSEDEDRFKSRAAFWGPFFFEHFVNSDPNEGVKGEEDDCVYFVNKYDPTNKATDRFSVRRKGGKNVFPQVNDLSIEWEESFFFNTIFMNFDYTIEVSIREKQEGTKALKMLKKVTKKVYATPHKVRLDDSDPKSDELELTYPLMYFAVSDFDHTWKDIFLEKDEEMICVELFASGDIYRKSFGKDHRRIRLFSGGLSNQAHSTPSTLPRLNFSGPKNKGSAQMAVSPYVEEEAEEKKTWKDSFWKIGNAIKSIPIVGAPPSRLNCSLTYLNIRWDLIVRDMLDRSSQRL
ncbi:hypothetical protein PROFUN_10473 [Planoprotostelium fungivorum]|uniref:Uncharacterized protein n=1 Tax=Planoprotostelium fungivorum TaxID=1890364 RepID=A0A2P6NDE8_9EUKA|nr:hypothetical protein PROFUN_10473 [Planoprotostelium fungivorum]